MISKSYKNNRLKICSQCRQICSTSVSTVTKKATCRDCIYKKYNKPHTPLVQVETGNKNVSNVN